MAKTKKNGISYGELEKAIRAKRFSPIYLFYGDEDLFIDEIVDLLIKQTLDESSKSFNLDVVGNESIDAKDVISLISAYPMMTEYRIVVVDGLDRVTNRDLLLPIIENPVRTTIAVFITEKPDFRVKLFKTFQDHGTIVEFKRLYDNEIPGWINKHVESRGKKVTLEASLLIQSHVGRSLREIQNEIDKLFIYIGDKNTIDADDVTAIVGMSRRYNIFELQKAIGKRDISISLEILEHMLNAGEPPVRIVTLLTTYFSKLLKIWEYLERRISKDELIRMLHLSPQQLYFLDDDISSAKMFSLTDIEQSFSILVETDEKLKSVDIDEKMLLTLMLYNLITKNKDNVEKFFNTEIIS